MSTGYWDVNSEADYYNASTHGSYQYQELDELINTFIAYYVGENKIIPKAAKEDIAFFARRAAQELSYDTLRSKETWEFDVPNSAKTVFPHNFVGYTNVYWSSPGGVKRPLYPTRLTQNPFRPTASDEPFTQTITTETITEPQIIENQIPSNTKVYVFYDGTSMGVEQTALAYQSVTLWLDGLTGFTRVENKTSSDQNVFHVAVAGERWLDWASLPMTGQFNNNNIKSSTLGANQASFTSDNTDDTFYALPLVTAGHVDNVNSGGPLSTESKALSASYWSFLNAGDSSGSGGVNYQFYDIAQPVGSGLGVEVGSTASLVYTADDSNQTITFQGAPPMAAANDDVLVIIFADEANFAYHGNQSNLSFRSKVGSMNSTAQNNVVSANSGTPVVQPTSIYKNDYDEYVKNYDTHTGNYNVFLYPKEQLEGGVYTLGGVRKQYLLHTLAAISSGNQDVPDGTWQDGTAPTFDASPHGSSTADVDLSILEATPPLGGYDNANPNPNPYWNAMNPQYGGLDQYGFGLNVDGGEMTTEKFETDLNDFIAGSVEEEITYNTYDITNVETSGQNYWQINDDGSVAGSYGGVTQQEFMSGDFGEPLVVDQDYDHSYGNVSLGQRYGIVPEHAQVNGSYFMDYKNGCIFFNPSLIGQTVVLDYLSDGIDSSGNMMIHKFAEEAFYKHVAYAIASTGSNYSPATVQMLKKERFAETRKAKIRLSNFKSQEFAQIMRNKAQWIKR